MAERESPFCPECDAAFDFPDPPPVDRRGFLRAAGSAALVAGLAPAAARAADKTAGTEKKSRPAEELIRELCSGLDESQKKKVVLPFDHGAGKGKRPTRLGMFNAPIQGIRLQDVYTKPQIDLLDRIVKAMSSGDEGFRQISRNGRWDASGAFDRCGAMLFGNPHDGKYAFVFAGHHLTIRCDGDSEAGAAFGGPIYYGHSPQGYSRGNIFNYQTRSVQKVHAALDEKQRQKATVSKGNPGEMDGSIRFKKKAEERPGIAYAELSNDQKALVEQVMRDVLRPFRPADVDEVMRIIKTNGGMERIQLAFYTEHGLNDKEPWEFWRLEGPGFVWNYRVLPHVHTYVNISSQLSGV